MKGKSFIARLAAIVMAFAVVLPITACNMGKGADTDQMLEVMMLDAGYGVQWGKDMLDAFKQEDWVKAKYPNIQTKFTSDGNMSTLTTKIDAGQRANTVDLFFGTGMAKYEGANASGYEMFADLTDVVYNATVPGEDVTVRNKMDKSYVDSLWYYEKGQDSNTPNVPFKAYAFPWASGMDGILYNAEYLEILGEEVPLTTNQFLEVCEKASSERLLDYNLEANGNYAVLTDSSGRYWYYVMPTWWAQYEGIDGYYDFCNGVYRESPSDPGRISGEIFKQKGKLYALQTLENILKYDKGYVYTKHTGLQFMQSQANFIRGNGVFYSNGDWFAKEMEATVEEIENRGQKAYDIRMMKTPIVSEIIEKTPSIPDEETLRAVIRAIDYGCEDAQMMKQTVEFKGSELVFGVTQADYEKILSARGTIHALGSSHRALVPSYAQGKEIAFDFLRFMATDKAQEIYMKATGGGSLPFEYNVRVKNPSLYGQLLPIEKDRLSFLYDSVYETKVMPDSSAFPLAKWGEMSSFKYLSTTAIVSEFLSKGSTVTAQTIFDEDIKYYVTAGEFDKCRTLAGLT